MRINFRQADYDALASVWSSFYPERYHVDANILRMNTIGSSVFDWGASAIEVEEGHTLGFVAIKKSASPGLYRGTDPDQAHLSAIAFKDPSVGVDLCAYAKSVLRNRGVDKIVFGQDSRHFFSGCPDDCPGLKSFLTVQGFEAGDAIHDVERDLTGYGPPSNCLNLLGNYPGCEKPVSNKPEVRPVQKSEVHLLDSFLQREFPGRWRHDSIDKIHLEGRSDFVFALYLDGGIEGFAVTQDWTHKAPVNGAIWKQDLGEKWGALGPIGVSKSVRGKGMGGALLGAALMGLSRAGAKKTIIDWTTLVDFYGKHGFVRTRSYRPFTLPL